MLHALVFLYRFTRRKCFPLRWGLWNGRGADVCALLKRQILLRRCRHGHRLLDLFHLSYGGSLEWLVFRGQCDVVCKRGEKQNGRQTQKPNALLVHRDITGGCQRRCHEQKTTALCAKNACLVYQDNSSLNDTNKKAWKKFFIKLRFI